jgi:iron complex outermembrane receptor protein
MKSISRHLSNASMVCIVAIALTESARAAPIARIDIPPQQMGGALHSIGLQTRKSEGYDASAGAQVRAAQVQHSSQATEVPMGETKRTAELDAGDIVVTARRSEERLQDVPISITVFTQKTLEDNNVVSPSDLAIYTPSLSVNQQYGAEKSSFIIRGFTQESNTAPSVGVYFADVVAPRSQVGTTSGNNVGPGSFVDLQNVQVLKGPQGTLFGRNTTGGAILVVPRKPNDQLGGYIEGSVGDFNLRRVQGVLNVPLADTFKVRLMIDRNKRDGYLRNHSGIGPDTFSDSNYFAARLGIIANITPTIENYTLATYSHSFSHGYGASIIACERDPTKRSVTQARYAQSACNQLDRQNARGDGPLDVEIDVPDPIVNDRQWQISNTTTWSANESLVVKNIISYAEFREAATFSLGGGNLFLTSPPLAAGSPLIGTKVQSVVITPENGYDGSAQSTFTEELQFQGNAFNRKLTWQAGAYLEISNPLGWSSYLAASNLYCPNVQAIQCVNPFGVGTLSVNTIKIAFENKALYAQGTYKLDDRFSLTAGIRYTMDITRSSNEGTRYTFPASGPVLSCNDTFRFKNAAGGPLAVANRSLCHTDFKIESKRPTWLIDLDYHPTDDILIYGKWARGYRQGSINTNVVGLETSEPEKVDSYEIGAKASFRGAISGYVNVSAFYNDFTNQQIRALVFGKPSSGLTVAAAVVNAGKSRIQGVEAEGSVTVFGRLKLDVGYSYLDTKLVQITIPVLGPDSPYASVQPSAVEGAELALSPKNRVNLSATYRVPVDKTLGDISVGATFVHTDSQLVSPATLPQYRRLPATDLLNLNASWNRFLGTGVDLSAFMTNVTNVIYPVNIGSTYTSSGFESAIYAAPRMWGFRLRYNFGE